MYASIASDTCSSRLLPEQMHLAWVSDDQTMRNALRLHLNCMIGLLWTTSSSRCPGGLNYVAGISNCHRRFYIGYRRAWRKKGPSTPPGLGWLGRWVEHKVAIKLSSTPSSFPWFRSLSTLIFLYPLLLPCVPLLFVQPARSQECMPHVTPITASLFVWLTYFWLS